MSRWLRKFVSGKPTTPLKIIPSILIGFVFVSMAWGMIGKADAQDSTRRSIETLSSKLDEATKHLTMMESAIHDLQNHPYISSDEAKYLRELYATKQDVAKMNDYVKQEEALIFESEIKNRTEMEESKNELLQVETRISQEEFSIGGQYFQIFGIVLSIVGVISGLAIVALGYIFNDKIANAKSEIEGHMTEIKNVISALVTGEMFAQIVMPWWEDYEEDYQNILRSRIIKPIDANSYSADNDSRNEEKSGLKSCMRNIRIARRLSESGLRLIKPLYQERYKSDIAKGPKHRESSDWILTCYAKLYNNWIYHRTAELICTPSNVTAVTQNDIASIIEGAEQCLFLSRHSAVKNLWYDLQQTSAFALLHFSQGHLKESGRQIMRDLLQGKVPNIDHKRPPLEWLIAIYDECFLIDSNGNTRIDVFGLGNDIRRAA